MNISPLANIVGNEVSIGKNVRIDPFVTITGNVVLGDNVHIGVGVCIFGGGGVVIGNDVSLSPGCKLFSTNEDADSGMLSNPQVSPRYCATGEIRIGDRSVIGSNAIVLQGVEIGHDVQVGALSLVTKDLQSGYIYAGIPVRRIRAKPMIFHIHKAA